MKDYIIRQATFNDIDFIVETIIEAEKSGTSILSYTTLFGLSEAKTRECLRKMLEEDIDGCDLSLSGFLLAEKNGEPAAALNAWVEGAEGISSAILKGNLFSYYFPKDSLIQAKSLIPKIADLSMHYEPGNLWLGYGYVAPKHRGNLFLIILCQHHILKVKEEHPEIKKVYCPMFAHNFASIQNFKLIRFKVVKEYYSTSDEITHLLPYNKKVLMLKTLN